jgi:hypothetical protein
MLIRPLGPAYGRVDFGNGEGSKEQRMNTNCTKCVTPVNKPYFYNRAGELVCFDCLMADKPEVTVIEVKRSYVPGGSGMFKDWSGKTIEKKERR